MNNCPKVNIAVVGATGIVADNLFYLMKEFSFPVKEIYLLASKESSGKKITINGKETIVQDINTFDFENIDIAFFSAGIEVSKTYIPLAVNKGCYVIDNTSLHRRKDDIPLIIPEINSDDIYDAGKTKIISNPNCSTALLLMVVYPIFKKYGLKSIDMSTYQSMSGLGKDGIEVLKEQSLMKLNNNNIKQNPLTTYAFNVVPFIDEVQENGFTKEEMKTFWETKKILKTEHIAINTTAVRVPVLNGHSESVCIVTEKEAVVKDIIELLSKTKGIKVMQERPPTAIECASRNINVYVGRIRKAIDKPNGINMWIVGDNLMKGAALNMIQIAELLLNNILSGRNIEDGVKTDTTV